MRGDTGSPRADAEADFLRARRLQVIAALTARLLGKESGDRKRAVVPGGRRRARPRSTRSPSAGR